MPQLRSTSPGRASLAFAGLALAAFLTGCSTVGGDRPDLAPIPVDLLAEMRTRGMSPADPILVRIFKEESELEVWKRDRTGRYVLLRTYPMCRWSGQLGPKRSEGDRQAPEGFYTVQREQMHPRSQYHLAFNLGYPNALERASGSSGSALMVHGACTSSGCYALTDSGVSEIYALAREAFQGGAQSFQVQAFPFRMTPRNLARHRLNSNLAFWQNLRVGDDHFLATGRPPEVAACGRRYVFNARPSDPSNRLDAARPCPALQVDPEVARLVEARRTEQDAAMQQLVREGALAVRLNLIDGGMHASFRDILRQSGPDRLRMLTSSRAEVSRPNAVLNATVEQPLQARGRQ